jgi:hypothetical protein
MAKTSGKKPDGADQGPETGAGGPPVTDRAIKSGEITVRARQAIIVERNNNSERFAAGDKFTVSEAEAARCGDLLERIPESPKPGE